MWINEVTGRVTGKTCTKWKSVNLGEGRHIGQYCGKPASLQWRNTIYYTVDNKQEYRCYSCAREEIERDLESATQAHYDLMMEEDLIAKRPVMLRSNL